MNGEMGASGVMWNERVAAVRREWDENESGEMRMSGVVRK